MTIDDFNLFFNKRKKLKKYYYQICFIALFSFSVFMLLSLTTHSFIKFSGNRSVHFISFVFIFLFCSYSLWELQFHFKLRYFKNSLNKQENLYHLNLLLKSLSPNIISQSDNYVNFSYRTKWWKDAYEYYIFVDNNLIVINAEKIPSYRGSILDLKRFVKNENLMISFLESN
jgi:hypothetical protein